MLTKMTVQPLRETLSLATVQDEVKISMSLFKTHQLNPFHAMCCVAKQAFTLSMPPLLRELASAYQHKLTGTPVDSKYGLMNARFPH